MTRVLPGVMVAPGVGNGVVPGGIGAALGSGVELGLAVGVGLGDAGEGEARVAPVHPTSSAAAIARSPHRMRTHRYSGTDGSHRSPGRRPPSMAG